MLKIAIILVGASTKKENVLDVNHKNQLTAPLKFFHGGTIMKAISMI